VAVWRHRASGSQADGVPLRGYGTVPKVWLAVTSALAVVMIVYPGLTGLWELRRHAPPDIEVNVTGSMWQWTVEYPKSGVKVAGAAELVLPADRTVQVNVRSLDILHSFWVPAFRQKIDAVPGQVHTIYVTPDRPGDPSDIAYRLQCAELCGVGHAVMSKPVRVLEPAEFERWLASQQRAVEAR
jgi:cytochrome c oxidase subunit 2